MSTNNEIAWLVELVNINTIHAYMLRKNKTHFSVFVLSKKKKLTGHEKAYFLKFKNRVENAFFN
ncbi:hypothetical protein BpHYR1_042645 [Brachionus plicatilis]|uniref:Uncharacterized protein n=1 Tax=Brachionus plicatilis TaxID=10195 RepID=A0A3M7T7P8_BRAPC|nr:hypothetical protein BpHYR1_042645 [Brachionus plicatilis]